MVIKNLKYVILISFLVLSSCGESKVEIEAKTAIAEAKIKYSNNKDEFKKQQSAQEEFVVQASTPPDSFTSFHDPNSWTEMPINADINYSLAFSKAIEIVSNNGYELESLQDGKYFRTAWNYMEIDNGRKYRTRILFNFSSDRKKYSLKAEAEFYNPIKQQWIRGYDTEILKVIKEDLRGSISY
ncbi:MAG: hypothetical protein LBQ34_01780 [Alphaproteobacteria bacterium]|jgi:hypothetical protein|nr:hypothetical protein [Alphaproteobacteria bacterium]